MTALFKELAFRECDECAAKPGSPVLCADCLARREEHNATGECRPPRIVDAATVERARHDYLTLPASQGGGAPGPWRPADVGTIRFVKLLPRGGGLYLLPEGTTVEIISPRSGAVLAEGDHLVVKLSGPEVAPIPPVTVAIDGPEGTEEGEPE